MVSSLLGRNCDVTMRPVTRRTDLLSSLSDQSRASVSTQRWPIIDSATSLFTSFRSFSQEEVHNILRYVISDQVLLFELRTYFHITRIHRCTSAVHHSDSQRVSSARSAARFAETHNCHAASKETWPRHEWCSFYPSRQS